MTDWPLLSVIIFFCDESISKSYSSFIIYEIFIEVADDLETSLIFG